MESFTWSKRTDLANSAVAQLLLGFSSYKDSQSQDLGTHLGKHRLPLLEEEERVLSQNAHVSVKDVPPRKRKRTLMERKNSESDKSVGVASSDTDDDTSVKDGGSSDLSGSTSASERMEHRCSICPFVAVSDEELRGHYAFHRRRLAATGRYQHPMWVSRRRTISDSPVLLSSSSREPCAGTFDEKVFSLKELLIGHRQQTALASSCLRNMVASVTAKAPSHGDPGRDDSPRSDEAKSITEAAEPTAVSGDVREAEERYPDSSDSQSTASTCPSSLATQEVSSLSDRWQGSTSPHTPPSPAQSKATHLTGESYPGLHLVEQTGDAAFMCSNSQQPIDLSSGPRTVPDIATTRSSSCSEAAVQCDLLKSKPDPLSIGFTLCSLVPPVESEVTSSSTLYRCPFCCIAFEDEVLFSIHMGCHSHSDPWMCNVCGKRTNNKYAFYTHIMRGHSSTT